MEGNRIERLEIMNFKSYKGGQTIGPFKNFTAIIGPNGAGKSNVMDAISFVFGIHTAKLRGRQLHDLIHNFASGTVDPRKTQCYVKLVFIDSELNEITFQRSILPSGSSEYRYNSKVVSWEQYEGHLNDLNILVKNPNCLVFQGEVESIARKSPKELTVLMEQISGSDEYKADYDRLLSERDNATQNTDFLRKQLRGLVSERKEYRGQKNEADAHAQLSQHLQTLKLRHILFQLYNINSDVKQAQKEISAKTLEAASVNVVIGKGNQDISAKRKEIAALMKNLSKEERALQELQSQLEESRPKVIVATKEEEHIKRKILNDEHEIEEAKQRQEIQKHKILTLQKELLELEEQEKLFHESEERALAESGKINLSESQLKEFGQIKEKARVTFQADRFTLSQLEREQNGDLSSFNEVFGSRMNELQSKLQLLEEEEIKKLERRLQMLNQAHTDIVTEKQNYEKELDQIQKDNADVIRQQAQKQEKLSEIQESLRSARIDMTEADRRSKMEESLESMKRLFPGVYGRIFDLVNPSHEKYRIALTVVLGANIDSIVVSDRKTALECIQYLKEQRVGTATFIPLDSIKTSVAYDRLRVLEPGVIKPIIDVLNYDSQFQSAVEYVCGNTLVCADIDKAREWAFNKGKKYKVCTMDGILIAKSGLMTGGIAGVEARARRWELKKVAELKSKRDGLMSDIAKLSEQLRNVVRERELQTLLQNIDARISANQIDRELAQRSIEKLNKEISALKEDIAKNKPEYERLKNAIETRAPKISSLKQKISEEEDALYADVSKKFGVPNIREWEENRKNRLRIQAEKSLTFKTQRSRISNLLSFAQQKEDVSLISKLENSLLESQTMLSKMQEKVKNFTREVSELESEYKASKAQYDKIKSEVDEKEKELKALIKDVDFKQQLVNAMNKRIDGLEASLQQFRERRHQLYKSAVSDDIELPVREGEEALPKTLSEKLRSKISHQNKKKKPKQKKKNEDSMDVDGEEDGEEDGENSVEEEVEMSEESEVSLPQTQDLSTQAVQELVEDEDAIVLDFSVLPEEYRSCQTQAQREEKNHSLLSEIQTTTAKMESIAPNYKATEKLDDVATKIAELKESIEESTQQVKRLTEELGQVRMKRNELFMNAYTHISNAIDEIYKKLTNQFGVAHLTLDSNDEPYLHPMRYSAVPRYKTFRDIEDLSGGEKSVAALALLFAIHSYRPSPFFVLDEVDAALDSANVEIVAQYFKERSQDMQFVLISLKDRCFDKADSLVGVFLDKPNHTSKSITLDLSKYEQ